MRKCSVVRLVGLDLALLVSGVAAEPSQVCGTCAGGALPAGTPSAQYYELVPGVIDSGGGEGFRILVRPGRPVARIHLTEIGARFAVADPDCLDDGTGGDAVAGDGVFTSGEIIREPLAGPARFGCESETLEGLAIEDVASVAIVETDGSEVEFLVEPSVGLLDPDQAPARVELVDDGCQLASHLVNLRGPDLPVGQARLHDLGGGAQQALEDLIAAVYEVLPDDFDFLVVLSTVRGELLPRTASPNYIVGLHLGVKNSVQGIGLGIDDRTGEYGSGGRLLGVNLLDAGRRGLSINNAVHELTHQWSAAIDWGLGLKSDAWHWSVYSNVGSILGGYGWIPRPEGGWWIDDERSRSRIRRMAPMDRYLAGFGGPHEVGPLMLCDPAGTHPVIRLIDGIPVRADEVVLTRAIEDVIAVHGPRVPAAVAAQHHFRIGFVVESNGRLLNQREMSYYNLLAGEFERLLARAEPDPLLASSNWVPATRYFGPGVTLATRIRSWDEDEDGLPDDWERLYLGGLDEDGGSDRDGDGRNHASELAFHGHPDDPDLPRGLRIYRHENQLCFEATRFQPGRDYGLEGWDPAVGPAGGWTRLEPDQVLGPHLRIHVSLAAGEAGAPWGVFRCRVTP